MENKSLPLQFDEETWNNLPDYLGNLPESVKLHVWGDADASTAEFEAVRLARTLSERFARLSYVALPRRVNYDFYPVIGVMRLTEPESIDYGVRLIGLPAGVQMTSLLTAIQAVAFQGMTSEAKTRIQLKRLSEEVTLELITSAEDEAGTVMAHRIFNMAVASPYIRSFLIMGDAFPDALIRYSIREVPHLVINSRVHIEGIIEERAILDQIAVALGRSRDK